MQVWRSSIILHTLPGYVRLTCLRTDSVRNSVCRIMPESGATAAGMREVAQYADGLGPDKNILAPVNNGSITYTTNFVTRCIGALSSAR